MTGAQDREGRRLGFEVTEHFGEDEWQAIADASPWATFFHTPVWLSMFVKSDPATRNRTRIFRFADGAKAVFPLLEHRRLGGLYALAESSAAGCYGGWISGDELTSDHGLAMARNLRAGCRNLVWRVNPLDPLGSVLDDRGVMRDTTEILDLRGISDEETLRSRFRHSARKQIAKGQRAGFTHRVAEKWEEWETYYRLYQTRMEHWGKETHSRWSLDFFRAAYEARGPKVTLWIVLGGDAIVGGNLNFYQSRHCVEWHAAYNSEFFHLGVRDFLVDRIIADAWARGFAWYDFNPSAHYEGTRRFKQTFGTIAQPCNVIIWKRGLYRLGQARRALASIRGRRRREGTPVEPLEPAPPVKHHETARN